MRVLVSIGNIDVCEFDVQVLVNRMQGPADAEKQRWCIYYKNVANNARDSCMIMKMLPKHFKKTANVNVLLAIKL